MITTRLIITNIDGTIIAEAGKKLDSEYLELIPQLRAAGYRVVIASGRPRESVEQLFEPVIDHIDIIANGGIYIKSEQAQRILDSIPSHWLSEINEDINELQGCEGVFCGIGIAYTQQTQGEMASILREQYCINLHDENCLDNLPNTPIGQVSIYSPYNIEEQLSERFLNNWRHRLNLCIASPHWLDCVMPGISKAAALRQLLAEYSIPASAVLASGNQMSDFEMLKLAGYTITVSGACPELHQIAEHVLDNSDYKAIARVWRKLLEQSHN